MIEKYIGNGLSVYKIAKETKLSESTVTYWLKKYGLKTKFKSFTNGYHKKRGIPEVAIRKAIKESICLADVLRKLNLGSTGYTTIKRAIDKYEIDTSHFDPEEVARRRRDAMFRQPIPLQDMLVKNSSFRTRDLKNRLYKEGIKKRSCELCGQGERWNGGKMALILDHKNGDKTNNELANLRILCPNCNAIQSTHCVGNRVLKRYFCQQCGKRIKKTSKHCGECKGLVQRKVERPNCDILKMEVSRLGYSATGRKYGVSDNAIRKWLGEKK